jgi:hypothetical protein
LLTSKSADFKKFPPSLLGIKNLQNQRRVDLSIFLAAHFKPNTKKSDDFSKISPLLLGIKNLQKSLHFRFFYF